MKKFFALLAVAMLAFVLVACGGTGTGTGTGNGGTTGKTIKLTYSGTGSDKDFNESLFEDFKAYKKSQGDTTNYVIEYVEHGPDAVDSEVLDWAAPNAPDVYEFASDKIGVLNAKGALAKITGDYKTFIETEMTDFTKDLVTIQGEYYAYPYNGDNTYYLQYDGSVFAPEDVVTIEGLLDKAQELGKKVAYNLGTAYWGGGALFTFGADFAITYDEDGNVAEIAADFDSEAGLKAAKAIYKIVNHPAWVNDSGVPAPDSDVAAVIGGTWDIIKFKERWADYYQCAVMPTVTIDGDTQHLGCFLGGKTFGVNPQVSQNNVDRFVAANELAKYLAGHDAQTKRYLERDIFPCIKSALSHPDMEGSQNVAVLEAQFAYARIQTAVPANFWTAPTTLVEGIINGTYTADTLQLACDNLNEAIKQSK